MCMWHLCFDNEFLSTSWNNGNGPTIFGNPTSFDIPRLKSAVICTVNLSPISDVVALSLL